MQYSLTKHEYTELINYFLKFTHLRKWRLPNAVERSPNEFTAEPRDSRRCANPVRRYQGVMPGTPRNNYGWTAWQQSISKPRGVLPKRRKHSNAPVSGTNFCCKSPTKPMGSPGFLVLQIRSSAENFISSLKAIITKRISWLSCLLQFLTNHMKFVNASSETLRILEFKCWLKCRQIWVCTSISW